MISLCGVSILSSRVTQPLRAGCCVRRGGSTSHHTASEPRSVCDESTPNLSPHSIGAVRVCGVDPPNTPQHAPATEAGCVCVVRILASHTQRFLPRPVSRRGPRERTPIPTEFVSVVRFPAPGRDVARLGPNGATRGRRPERRYHSAAPFAPCGVSGRVGPTAGAGSGPLPPDTEVVR